MHELCMTKINNAKNERTYLIKSFLFQLIDSSVAILFEHRSYVDTLETVK